jgi:catechol 2,3-dioxygenase-like lactoylglutathione lyase family enzyme
MIRHVAGVAEIVEDVAEAARFYEGLGLKVNIEGGYGVIDVPGLLHFGIWSRADAAESMYGSRDAADRVPLGFHVEFEVDDVESSADEFEGRVVHDARVEPWGQKTLRFLAPSGVPCGVAETPWARELAENVGAKAPAEQSH